MVKHARMRTHRSITLENSTRTDNQSATKDPRECAPKTQENQTPCNKQSITQRREFTHDVRN